MYPRLILITFILTYVTAKKNCVLYVLDSEFTQASNLINCESGPNGKQWQVVNFDKVKILPRSKDSRNALLASTDSCVNLEIGFLSEGTLEADVYVSTPTCEVNIGISDTVISNESFVASSQIYPADKTLDLGWRKLGVDIEKYINNARVTLNASCKDGYVLLESFKYIPLGTSQQHCKAFLKQNLSECNKTIVTKKYLHKSALENNVKSNAEAIDVVITQMFRNDEDSSFWTPLTISLITSSIFVLLIILAISAYHCGKSKGLDEVNKIFWNDTDMTLTIPRARSIYSQSVSRSRNSGNSFVQIESQK